MSDQKSKKIFLILGISREKRNWKTPVEILQAALPDFEVIALDNPGMGEYHKMAVPLTIPGHVDFLKKDFEKLKGEENYFMGWSLGGMIVADWSNRYPKDMKGTILMTSSFGPLQAPWLRIKPVTLPGLVKTIFSKGIKREEGLFEPISNNKQNKERLVGEAMAYNKEFPVTGVNIIRQFIAASLFFTKSIKKMHPCLVLGAPNDHLVSNVCSKKIQSFWKTDYEEHPTAGHDIFNDDPQWVVTKVKDWMKTIN